MAPPYGLRAAPAEGAPRRRRRGAALLLLPAAPAAACTLCLGPSPWRGPPQRGGWALPGAAGGPTHPGPCAQPARRLRLGRPARQSDAEVRAGLLELTRSAGSASAAAAEPTGERASRPESDAEARARIFGYGAAAVAAAAAAAVASAAPAAAGPPGRGPRELELGAAIVVVSGSGVERQCTVVGADAERVKVHYDGFADDYDEWLPRDSGRIRGSRPTAATDAGSSAKEPVLGHVGDDGSSEEEPRRLRPGNGVRVMSLSGVERQCTVISVDADRVKVHYKGFDEQYDEWLPERSERILRIDAQRPPPTREMLLERDLLRNETSSDKYQQAVLALIRGDVVETQFGYVNALKAMQKRGDYRNARKVLSAMYYFSDPLRPTVHAYTVVISACAKARRPEEAQQLLEEMLENDMEPDTQTYTAVVRALARTGKMEPATQLLKEMRQCNIQPGVDTFLQVLRACEEEGHWVVAFQVFEELLEAGILPDRKVFNTLMFTCGNAGEFPRAIQIYGQMRQVELEPDLFTYLALINACAKVNQYTEALRFVKELDESGITLSENATCSVMDAYVNNSMPNNALDRFDDYMVGADLPMNRSKRKGKKYKNIYQAALRACLAAKNADRALQLLEEMEVHSWDMTVEMYRCVARTLERCERWDERMNMLLRMVFQLRFKVRYAELKDAFSSAMFFLVQRGRAREALDMFNQILRIRRPKVSLSIEYWKTNITVLIDALEEEGALKEAAELREEMGIQMGARYNQAVCRFGVEGQWEAALDVLQNAQEDRTAAPYVRNAVIAVCARAGQWEQAVAVFQGVEQEQKDVYTYTSTMQAMMEAGRPMEETLQLWEEMIDCGVEPTEVTYGFVVIGLETAGMWQKALFFFDEMRAKGFRPDEDACRAALAACQQGELWEAVVELYEEMAARRFDVGDVTREGSPMHSAAAACDKLGQGERWRSIVEERERSLEADRGALRAVAMRRWAPAEEAVGAG